MKRYLTVFLSLLVTVAVVLGLFVIHYRDRLFKEEHPDYYTLYEDLPAIKASDAAYLLDPTFVITDENLSDCIDKYFSAPVMLFFRSFPASSSFCASTSGEGRTSGVTTASATSCALPHAGQNLSFCST